MSSSSKIRVVDLFAGIGGLRSGVINGLREQGHITEVVFTSEIKKTAIQVLEQNYPDEPITGDITKVNASDVPDHDLLLAGFPCQAFSYAGARLGFQDQAKGTLFFDVARILQEKKPARFILENVEGLINHDPDPADKNAAYGRTFKTIISTLENLGYKVDWRLLVATDFGVPQVRKRVFITGALDVTPDLSLIRKSKSKPLSSILEKGLEETTPAVKDFSALLEKEYGSVEVLEGKIFRDWRGGDRNLHSWNFNFKGKTTKTERALMEAIMFESKKRSWIKPGEKRVGEGSWLTLDQVNTFAPTATLKQLQKLVKLGYLRELNGAYKISSGKLTMPISHILEHTSYANTLVATDADRLAVVDAETKHLRRFSNTELRRLFGFPDGFRMDGLNRRAMFDLFGNSVVIPMAEAVAKALYTNPVPKQVTPVVVQKTSFVSRLFNRFRRK